MNYYQQVLKNFLQKYLWELILILIAVVLALGSFALFLNSPPKKIEKVPVQKSQEIKTESKITVEIAGAVNGPGIYQLSTGSRLNDLLKLARGLSDQADKLYFARNFNLAKYVADQEKVYIPSRQEITQGLFSQNDNFLRQDSQSGAADESEKVDLNSASSDELDALSGIGEVTAQKIIDNRPYKTIDDLITKKVVKQNVFDSIKNQLIVK